jgi:hypothetical protein
LRYFLPPRVNGPGRLVYIPYWRLRGSAFVIDPEHIRHKVLDTNMRAVDLPGLPMSLGLRPQTLPLRFVEPETDGFFLRPEIDGATFKMRLLGNLPGRIRISGPHLGVCVGDVVSVVYQPVFQDKEMVDGISGRILGPACVPTENADMGRFSFTSTLCPQCGWDLEGDTQSLVQACFHCHTAWMPGADVPEHVDVRFLGSPVDGRYLPFWSLRFRAEGFPLASWADLLRLTGLPRVVRPWMENAPCVLRVPAFKIKPTLFLTLSSCMSLYPEQAVPREPLSAPLYPATLPMEEAVEALPLVLAGLSAPHGRILGQLRKGTLHLEEASIEYVPFVLKNRQWYHQETNFALQENALHWASAL